MNFNVYQNTFIYRMLCVSTKSKQHLQPDFDLLSPSWTDGAGQVAPDGRGRLCTPFHKRGLQLPPRLSAPKLTSPAGFREPAARQGCFHGPQTHLPDTASAQGYLLQTARPRGWEPRSRSWQSPLKSAALRRARG